jgi:hypothetical protein
VLNQGADFDQIILGISLGGLPYVCKELIDANPDWRQMVTQVKTVAPQAFQLWLKPDIAGLNSWSDMSHLLIRENWPHEHRPNHITYVCGSLYGPAEELPPPEDHDFPRRQAERRRRPALGQRPA